MIKKNAKDQSVIIELDGDLDAVQVEELRPRLKELILDNYRFFTFDLGHTRFMCSAGLGLLVETYNSVASHNGSLIVRHLSPSIERLLTETKLLSIFTSESAPESDQLEALQAVQKHMSLELLFLSYLNRISSKVLQADISSEIYDITLEGILRSLKSPRGMLLLVHEGAEGRSFHSVASDGFGPDLCRSIESMPLQPGSFEHRCLDMRQARLFNRDDAEFDSPSPLLKLLNVSEGVLSPICGQNRSLGLVVVAETEDVSITFFRHSAPLLQIFSNVCGLAIEKQKMLEDIQYKNKQLAQTLSKLNKTQDSLMEAGKLAVIGSMMRGLAHAMNNKLVPIMGYAQILGMQADEGTDLSEKIQIIEQSAVGIKNIIDNLRNMVVREGLHIEIHDIREVLDSALVILDYLFRQYHIEVRREYTEDIDGHMEMDRDRMIQALLSLFHRLPTAFAEQDKPSVTVGINRYGEDMVITLCDNGHSIPQERMRAILTPFDGSDDQFGNDKLNFGIANGVVKDHKGTFNVTRNETQGMCVEIRMPCGQSVSTNIFIG